MSGSARLRLVGAALCAAIAVGTVSADPSAPSKPTIEELDVRSVDGAFQVSFQVTGAFPSDVVELIESGAPVSFRHRVDVVARRGFPWLGSRLMARCEIVTTVSYDSLTRQYHLTRQVDLQPATDGPPALDARDTDDVDEVQAWMTELRDVHIPLPVNEDGQKPRKVKVQTNLGRRFVMLVFPASRGASAEFPLDS